MVRFRSHFLLIKGVTLTVLALILNSQSLAEEPWKPIPVTIGKETTFINGPLRPDGYPDYVEALRRHARRGVTIENNAAVLLAQTLGSASIGEEFREAYFAELGIKEPPLEGVYFIRFREFAEQHDVETNSDEFFDSVVAASTRPWSPADYPLIDQWLKSIDEPLRKIATASERSHLYFPIVSASADPDLQKLLSRPILQLAQIVRALEIRAMLRLGTGQLEQAQVDVQVMYRLEYLMQESPDLLTRLVGSSFRSNTTNVLVAYTHHGQPTAQQAKALWRHLERLPVPKDLEGVIDVRLRYELLDGICKSMREGPQDAIAMLRKFELDDEADQLLESLPKTQQDADAELLVANVIVEELLTAVGKPTFAKQNASLKELRQAGKGGLFDKMMRKVLPVFEIIDGLSEDAEDAEEEEVTEEPPSLAEEWLGMNAVLVMSLQEKLAKATTQHEQVRVALALAAYRHDQQRYPKDLDALVPKYIEKLPVDVYHELPLVYRREREGYLLYSFGPDGEDNDGGDVEDSYSYDDVTICVPLPELN